MSNQGTVYPKLIQNKLKNKQKGELILNVTLPNCARKQKQKQKQNPKVTNEQDKPKLTDTGSSLVATVGKDGTGADESQGAECAVTEDLASGGEHSAMVRRCIIEPYT